MRAVAIINANARGLTAGLRRKLEAALPGRVRFTASLNDAREVIRREIAKGIDLLVFGGGDGTVVMGLTLLDEACRGTARPEPAVGVLRLGSGNAIADTVGATKDPAGDLARLVHTKSSWVKTQMLDVMGVRAPFVGVGVDAQLLEDQQTVSNAIDRVPIARSMLGGASRYALSVALRSLPRFATVERPHARVINKGSSAIAMKKDGPTGVKRAANDLLWEGACTLVAGATIPYFGFGLKMFAFAGTADRAFHLRCGDAGLFEILRNTPAAFRGEYFSANVTDYLCDRVEIVLDRETAIEAGGELLGRRTSVELSLGSPVTFARIAR
ncbi:MAG TPA: diacylglycerol kinase family protein [Kofleriaceae bacterium]